MAWWILDIVLVVLRSDLCHVITTKVGIRNGVHIEKGIMKSRPGESPQKSGRRFESFWAKIFGVKPTPGSGNTWRAKLDVGDGSITWSLKWTTRESFTISKALLKEAEVGIYQNGDNTIPGIAVAIEGGDEVVVVLRQSDFERLLAMNPQGYIKPTRGEQKRARASVPVLLRDDE